MSFEDFWSIYPRRIAKLAAKRKYEQALRHASDGEILAGAHAYARVTANTEMQFIKHPATWLSGGCWDDDMAAVAPRSIAQSTGIAAVEDQIRREISDHYASGSARQESDDPEAVQRLPELGWQGHNRPH